MFELFGYKLMLVKKDALREYESFKQLIPKMKEFIEDFSDFIRKGIEIGPETAFILTSETNILSTLIDIYFNNRYSNPSSSMMLYKHLSLFQKDTRRMLDLFVRFEELQNSANIRAQKLVEENNEIEMDLFEDQLQKLTNEGFELVRKTALKMLNDLKHIKCCILSDYTRLEMGVDIMKEYKRRKSKHSLSEKDFMNEFTVKFKVLSNSDRHFIEKEKMKNERSRNGTSDGGVSKEV